MAEPAIVIANVNVIDDTPIIWEPLPHLTYEDGNQHRLRLKDYINAPVGEARFELHPDYELPNNQWRLSNNGNLRYRPIVGRTIELRFNATRGNQQAYSDTLRITRTVAFITRLVPNRIFVGAAFNDALGRIYIYNSTDIGVTPTRWFISSFNTEGVEQVSESVEVGDINGRAHSGNTWDGTRHWLCGRDSITGVRNLVTINTDGTQEAVYDYSGGHIESLAWDGSSIWGLDTVNRQLRKFSTEGVEDTTATITLARATTASDMEGFYFGIGQYGLTYGDGHFWIPQLHITGHHYVFCCDSDGNAVSSRHFEVPFGDEAGGTIVGVAWQESLQNIWHIHDLENDAGERVGTIRVHGI